MGVSFSTKDLGSGCYCLSLPLGPLCVAQKQCLAVFSASEPLGLFLLLFTMSLANNSGWRPPATGEKLSSGKSDAWTRWKTGPLAGRAALLLG